MFIYKFDIHIILFKYIRIYIYIIEHTLTIYGSSA